MSHLSQYALLAVAGLITGVAAHRISASVRGSVTRHLILRYLIEGIAILPGIALMGFVLGQRGASRNLFDFVRVFGAFFVPHVAGRIGAHTAVASRRVRRENTLPFEHWFDLLETNAAAAPEFLAAYLAHNDRQRIDSLPDLQAASAALQEAHAGHPLLAAALDKLAAEIARLKLAARRASTRR